MSYKGQPFKRMEDSRLVTGGGSYVDDMKLPGMLHASFLRSPHAHARIVSIDMSRARSQPGVLAVLSGEDTAGVLRDIPSTTSVAEWNVELLKVPEIPALARSKVYFVGQAVAVVVASDHYLASDAAGLIKVEYEPLPPLMDPLEAAEEDSTPVHDELGTNVGLRINHDRQGGRLDEAFAGADRVVRHQFTSQRLAPVPMETRGLIVQYDAREDMLTVWASIQNAHRFKELLSAILERSPDTVRVVTPDVGGGFGEKLGPFPEDVAVAYLALTLGSPVKWVADRQENMLGFHGRGHTVDIEAAVKNDGTILGIRLKTVADGGGYFAASTIAPPYLASHRIVGPYRTPTARVEVVGVVTNKPYTGAYRGAGGPESAFCMERLMDLIAMELDMDPSEVRRKNFIAPDAFPYETPTGLVYDSGSYEKAMDRALELSDYRDWKEKARQSVSSDGPLIGVGLATVVKLGGHGGGSEDAWIKIDSSGKITALTGVSPHGQGSATTFAQIVADELGVTPYDVEVLHGDTALVPAGGGTAATRGSVMGGSAMYLVVQKAHDKLAHIASHLMGCPAEDAVFEEGRVYDRNHPQKTMAFAEVASAAYNEELLPPDAEVGLDFEGTFLLGKANHSPHAFAAHVVVVEVDRDTGESKIVRYIAVHDCGRIINPMLFDGQVHGAIAQGIGQAMTEGMEYDQTGQPLTASLMDYAVPFAEETPAFVSDTADTPSPLNPLGIKGVGELPTVAAPPAVANAVMDALSHAGVRHVETPLTPEKVWRALHGKGQ